MISFGLHHAAYFSHFDSFMTNSERICLLSVSSDKFHQHFMFNLQFQYMID